jgi:SagB-type dehydrogenase family enzyme
MKEQYLILPAVVVFLIALLVPVDQTRGMDPGRPMKSIQENKGEVIILPAPEKRGSLSLEEALYKRESVRSFSPEPLTVKEISQILWAAQGKTRHWGGRTSPSAGALYPLEIYMALREGLYKYVPNQHQMLQVANRNFMASLSDAALGQGCVREAPAVVIITAVYERMGRKYGSRGERYVMIEVGHAAQNILLQAVSLGLSAVPVGAFHDEKVRRILSLPDDHKPLYLIPVGHGRR